MSYLRQASYQQKWPHSRSDQGYYGPQQGHRNETEHHYRMDDRNPRDDRGYRDQRNEYNNYNNNAQQYGGYRDLPPERNSFGGPPPNQPPSAQTHRYPETFHDNRQPQNQSTWGQRNDQTNDRGYQKQQYEASNNFRDRGRSQSPVNHDNHYDPYGRGRQRDSQSREWANENQQPHHDRNSYNQPLSPGWQNRGRDDQRYPPPRDSMYSNQAPNLRDQPNHSTHQVNSDWHRDPPDQNHHPPRSYEQPRNGYAEYNQHPQSQRQFNERYRDDDYGRDMQPSSKPPSDPPQIMAKNSGSSAVFGVVARVDTSPTRRGEPVSSPIRTDPPPVTSPTREYAPQFDQYRNPEPNRSHQPPPQTSQQHQYHHALTPISEKPSPPSSSGSRSQPHESSWSIKSTNDQYDHQTVSRPPWHGQPDRGYPDQRNGPPPQSGPGYSNNTQPPQPNHDRPQHQPRTGYRDYEYTESSGYGSESTHYTERSYNEPQRFPDKGQYDNRYPPETQRMENFSRSPVESYSRSPPRGHDEGYSDRLRQDNIRSTSQSEIRSPSQRFDQRSYQQEPYNQPPQDSYGPPVSIPQQRPYNERQAPPGDRYNHQPYDSRGPPPNQNQSYGPRNDTNLPLRSPNAEGGVEESHVKSVRAAKNMFEKQTDPRRPPPAPKPLVAPKPNNVRPIPPRPANFSNENWGPRPDNRDQFQPRSPQGPKSPRSPNYDLRPQAHYQSRMHPSQSLDNLDDRTRYQPPPVQRPPQHAQSMQNLDDRSLPPPQRSYHPPDHRPQGPPDHRSQEGYRNSYSGGNSNSVQPDNRPMVVAVKYNQDTGASLYTAQEPPRHDSWDRPRPESDRPRPQASPTRLHAQRSSWSTEPNRGSHQQSYNDSNRNAAPDNSQNTYGQSRMQNNDKEQRNYVPDVVARSYEMANQTQQHQSPPQPQYNQDSYDHRQDPVYESRRQPLQNTPENRNSLDRWPTPPPPITQEQPTPPRATGTSYNDDWRRPGPPPTQLQSRPPNERRSDYPPKNPTIHLPPPPQQPYPYDSDSSEVDVDAPTPPPSGKQSRLVNLTENTRGESPYERNKPVPVGARNPDSWRRLPHQPQNVTQPDEPPYSKQPLQNNQTSVKAPRPQKPQRNSTSLSPKLARTSVSNDQNDAFDLDVASTPPLVNQTSRERMRLVKSGGMANRKPPSRQGSTSNLLEIGDDEDNFQIEVTDSDLSNKATPIEVHRMESMRILNAKKEKEKNAPSSALERQTKQRASQKLIQPPTQDDEPSTGKAAPYKKPDTKLVYKMPSADAAKTIPMPQITEPVKEATRRPPTYLGFGNTPEKPKTDLLSQFKSARDSALHTAAQKQNKALKSVSALVKFSQGKKEPKSPPKPKLTTAEKNARVLDKMNIEVRAPEEDDRDRSSHHRHDDERRNVGRSSTRSSSTIKAEKYDGDDDTTNGSRHGRDARGRGRDRQRDTDRAKSRGRSTSRGRNLSPEDRGRSRHRSKSRERSLSPEERHRPRRDQGDRRYDDRELDMDAFEREVKRATSYNSDFEQPEPRRQMLPTKLMAKGAPQRSKRQPPPGDWMNALKERNKNAARARFGHVPRY